MAAIDVTKKLLIYHTLYRLNLSFSNIVTQCRTLQEAGVFSAKSTRLFQGYTHELQAEMNQELLDTMHATELVIGVGSAKSAKRRKSGSGTPMTCSFKPKNEGENSLKSARNKAPVSQ
jgi:hypothetical protein